MVRLKNKIFLLNLKVILILLWVLNQVSSLILIELVWGFFCCCECLLTLAPFHLVLFSNLNQVFLLGLPCFPVFVPLFKDVLPYLMKRGCG